MPKRRRKEEQLRSSCRKAHVPLRIKSGFQVAEAALFPYRQKGLPARVCLVTTAPLSVVLLAQPSPPLPRSFAVTFNMQIKDSLFYITGGASGLGAATASHLHSLGAYVAIMDLQLEAGQTLASSLNSSGSKRAAAFEVDVCSEDAVSAAIAACDKLWPDVRVGGCVNCGGVGMAGKTINQDGKPFDLDTFRRTVEINLIGTFNVSRLTAARLVRDLPRPIPKPTESTEDLGVIINTASAAALEGQAGQCPYSASKGGVLSLTLPMARDLAWFGIRVMTLVPTLFETPMMSQLPDRARKAILRTCEFPARFGKPEEFALSVQAVVENPMLVSTDFEREKSQSCLSTSQRKSSHTSALPARPLACRGGSNLRTTGYLSTG